MRADLLAPGGRGAARGDAGADVLAGRRRPSGRAAGARRRHGADRDDLALIARLAAGVSQEGFPLESSGWKAESGTSILSSPETQAFYREVAAWAAGRGILRLAFLRVDGRPLAFQLGFEDGGAYYFMKGGYDPEQRQFAAQKLLVQAVLERAFASGLRSFEFLGEDEAWKLEWTDALRRLDLFHAFRPPLGLAEWAAVRLGPWKVARVLATRS